MSHPPCRVCMQRSPRGSQPDEQSEQVSDPTEDTTARLVANQNLNLPVARRSDAGADRLEGIQMQIRGVEARMTADK